MKVPVKRRWLYFAVATLWQFAAVRVLMTSYNGMIITHTPVLLYLFVSLAGAVVFFRTVFLKVSRKYISRIHAMPDERHSIFAMMSLRSYLLIAVMISMGIIFSQYELVPKNLLSMFLGSLGLSLLTSSVLFFRAWHLMPVRQKNS